MKMSFFVFPLLQFTWPLATDQTIRLVSIQCESRKLSRVLTVKRKIKKGKWFAMGKYETLKASHIEHDEEI